MMKKKIYYNILKYENLNKAKIYGIVKKGKIYNLFNNEIYKNIKIKPDYVYKILVLMILVINDIMK